MRIRIGDRVRLKREGDWGTVVWHGNRSHWMHIWMFYIYLDSGIGVHRTTRQLEKLPRYRCIPEARDMATAMRHLQEWMR